MMPTTRRNNRARVSRPSVRLPIPRDKLVELSPQHNKACMLCGRKEISELLYGMLYQLNDIIVHYFCLLFSSGVVQKGTDEEGFLGFLLKDIKAELTRGTKKNCFYCHKIGATVTCCKPKCKKTFHLPCGLENGSMHQYFLSFNSYCLHHRVIQNIDLKDLQSTTPAQCSICREDVAANPIPSSIWAPCCKRNAWFHRKCIQELALNSGYFFKCPLCNNVETFKKRMLTLGIYIPSRFASWEAEPNAFAEILERPSSCNIDNCLCPFPQKQQFKEETGPWEIVLCHICGSNGTHILCSSLKCDEQWICKQCYIITDPINVKRRRVEINNGVSNTLKNELALNNNRSLRHTNTRGVSRNNGARESIGLYSNKERIQNEPQTVNDSVVISDESSGHDSDVECITYVEPPEMKIVPRILNIQSIGMRMYNRYSTRASTSSLQVPQPRTVSPDVLECIDLTNSDDENEIKPVKHI